MFANANTQKVHVFSILIILTITIVYTFPLLVQITTAIPGKPDLPPDAAETVWSVGWVYQAISQGENVWHTDHLFAPYGADLRFNVLGFFQGLLAFPFVPLLGVVGSSNLILALTLFLNGICSYWLVYYHTRDSLSSLISSVCGMLSMTILWHFGVGRNGLTSVWVVWASLICLSSLLDSPSVLKSILLGIILTIALLTDLHVVVFTFLWNFFYLIFFFLKNGFASITSFRLYSVSAAFFIFAIAFVVIVLPAIPSLTQGEFPAPALDHISFYSIPIEQFILPYYIPYIYGFEFLLACIFAIVLFRWQGDYRFWLIASLIFLVLSLGPYLKPTRFPLPYTLVSIWEPLQNFRTPYRFVIPAVMGFAMVAGFVLRELFMRVKSQNILIIFCILFIPLRVYYSLVREPFPTQIYPEYKFYSQMAKDGEDYAILEVPFGIRSGLDQIGDGGERLQYYQPIHKKKLLYGSLARLPVSLFDFYRSHPSLLFLSGDLTIPTDLLSDDLKNILVLADVKYILVHRDLLSLEEVSAFDLFLNSQPYLKQTQIENDLLIYSVEE